MGKYFASLYLETVPYFNIDSSGFPQSQIFTSLRHQQGPRPLTNNWTGSLSFISHKRGREDLYLMDILWCKKLPCSDIYCICPDCLISSWATIVRTFIFIVIIIVRHLLIFSGETIVRTSNSIVRTFIFIAMIILYSMEWPLSGQLLCLYRFKPFGATIVWTSYFLMSSGETIVWISW